MIKTETSLSSPTNSISEGLLSQSLIVKKLPQKDFGVVAKEKIAKGTIVVQFHGEIVKTPGKHTVQIHESGHIDVKNDARLVNHSSTPNTALCYSDEWPTLKTLNDIAAGEEITFDYNTSEWKMAAPFVDETGNWVQGFSHLPPDAQEKLVSLCAPYIQRLYKSRDHRK